MENIAEKFEWFEEWFNTSYYHILYKNRNHQEAEIFVKNLVEELNIQPSDNLLDLACGKGRHAIFLNKLGLNVTGADLSSNSIAAAKLSENERLHFLIHDMREPISGQKFDFVFNLFTSFGYFDDQESNLKVLKSVYEMLKPKGKLVIDFFNLTTVLSNMKQNETKSIDGIDFHISKSFDGTHIHKNISFTDQGKDFSFTERVQALRKEDFEYLLNEAGFELLKTFGDFNLNSFNKQSSDRIILIAAKKA